MEITSGIIILRTFMLKNMLQFMVTSNRNKQTNKLYMSYVANQITYTYCFQFIFFSKAKFWEHAAILSFCCWISYLSHPIKRILSKCSYLWLEMKSLILWVSRKVKSRIMHDKKPRIQTAKAVSHCWDLWLWSLNFFSYRYLKHPHNFLRGFPKEMKW